MCLLRIIEWLPPCFVFVGICVFLTIHIRRKIKFAQKFRMVTKPDRGTRSERQLIRSLLQYGIPPHTIFHDLYIRKKNGKYAQLDVVVPTKVGVLVFEVKEYKGWLFGTGHQTHWTQVLAYGKKKFRLYNPIKQNENHILALKSQLPQFQNIPFYSIIVFYGDCVFKNISYVPNGTYLIQAERIWDVCDRILNHNAVAAYINKYEVLNHLRAAVQNGTCNEIRARHLAEIRELLGTERILD